MKIIISGIGGQGIKFSSIALGKILTQKNYEVSLSLTYDAAMSLGEIFSQIVFSKEKIENPLIEKADLLVLFSKSKKEFKSDKFLDFSNIKIPEEFEDRKNIVFLGKLLKEIEIDLESVDWKNVFKKNFKENKDAIKFGCNL